MTPSIGAGGTMRWRARSWTAETALNGEAGAKCLPGALSVRQRYIMNDRGLMNVTICCRGIPVGTAPLILRMEASGQPGFRIGPATHLPAYDGLIGRALRSYKEAKNLWTRMPYPAALTAQAQMAEAWNALAALWAALELRDEAGSVLPIPVERFAERVVSAKFADLPAGVVRQLWERCGGVQLSDPPAA